MSQIVFNFQMNAGCAVVDQLAKHVTRKTVVEIVTEIIQSHKIFEMNVTFVRKVILPLISRILKGNASEQHASINVGTVSAIGPSKKVFMTLIWINYSIFPVRKLVSCFL